MTPILLCWILSLLLFSMMALSIVDFKVDVTWIPEVFLNPTMRKSATVLFVLLVAVVPTTLLVLADHYNQSLDIPGNAVLSRSLFMAGMACEGLLFLVDFCYLLFVHTLFRYVTRMKLQIIKANSNIKENNPEFDLLILTFTKVNPGHLPFPGAVFVCECVHSSSFFSSPCSSAAIFRLSWSPLSSMRFTASPWPFTLTSSSIPPWARSSSQ